mmetsp:Transcript_28663/g.68373  ORF Transcript_28663/g.68373 Transcript_28663/m.68373 type:complete len:539 (+) Transcript_28663:291-1907(+)
MPVKGTRRTRKAQLYLIPTGEPGNDHSLDLLEGVREDEFDDSGGGDVSLYGQQVWGFLEGHKSLVNGMSPGDICLMTSPGTNKFNRLAMVQEVMLDCAELGRRVWGPRGLSYHMGGNKRTNKPFTSLFKLKHMRMVDDIVKQEMMARLGYDARDPLYGARCVRPRKGKCSISAAELDAVIEELRERLRQPETRTERWMRDQRLRELDGELAKVVRSKGEPSEELKKRAEALKRRIHHVRSVSNVMPPADPSPAPPAAARAAAPGAPDDDVVVIDDDDDDDSGGDRRGGQETPPAPAPGTASPRAPRRPPATSCGPRGDEDRRSPLARRLSGEMAAAGGGRECVQEVTVHAHRHPRIRTVLHVRWREPQPPPKGEGACAGAGREWQVRWDQHPQVEDSWLGEEELRAEAGGLEALADSLSSMLGEARAESERLRAENQGLKRKASEAEVERSWLRQENLSLRRRAEDAEGSLSTVLREKHEAERRRKELKQRLSAQRTRRQDAEQRLAAFKADAQRRLDAAEEARSLLCEAFAKPLRGS